MKATPRYRGLASTRNLVLALGGQLDGEREDAREWLVCLLAKLMCEPRCFAGNAVRGFLGGGRNLRGHCRAGAETLALNSVEDDGSRRALKCVGQANRICQAEAMT